LRQERIFTIDPETAKDLDDALSIKANEDGTYDIGVHIADVSHFVKPNSPLDRDAKKRATSVYLVQRAVPMLPPTLSEEICSLQPGQERLTFSVIFTVTKDAKIVNKWFGKTVIKWVQIVSVTVHQLMAFLDRLASSHTRMRSASWTGMVSMA
jgi:protein SSD1